MDAPEHSRKSGMSLTELLCVIAIIAILAALYLSTISRAFMHVKHFLKQF
jgi:prepilin-type N-terminal cleavage/methylation domain-containing protein